MKRGSAISNIFINIIKENYTFLLVLIGLVIVISIQGCQPSSPTLSIGNCCKIKDSSTLQTKACIAASKTTVECAEIASQIGSSYELAPASSCLNFARNPDCGTDEISNKIGCYLDDGSGLNKFIPQYNPDKPFLSCLYNNKKLYKCDQGKITLVEDCSKTPTSNYCINNICKCTDSDGGRDYFNSGSVKWYVSGFDEFWTQNDVCRDEVNGINKGFGRYLIELTCEGQEGNNPLGTAVSAVPYECPNGCENDACKLLF